MGGGSKAPKPDPNIGIAQKEMAAIAKEQLDFAREAFYAEQPREELYAQLSQRFIDSTVAAQNEQSRLANDYAQRMKGTFYPIEDTLAFDALGYYDASPEIQAKLEQSYLEQNRRLVEESYQNQLASVDQNARARLEAFQKQAGGLGLNVNSFAAPTQEIASAEAEVKRLSAQLAQQTAGSQAANKTSAELNAAKDRLTSLQAFSKEYADYTTIGEDGMTLADRNLLERKRGLQTEYEQGLQGVGSTLDTVRAYADSYRSGQEQQAGMARQDVANQFDARSQQLQRQLQSFGVDPTSGRFASTINSNNIMQAASEAAAMNQARNAAKQLGWAKRMDAAGLGRGLPGSQAAATGLAMQQGQGALGAQQSISQMNQASNSAFMNGLGAAGSTFNNLGQLGLENTRQQAQAAQAGGANKGALIGTVVMGAATAF